MTDKPKTGSFQAFLDNRTKFAKTDRSSIASTPVQEGLVVHEFVSVSKHLDDDVVELYLREARRRARLILEKEKREP